MEEELQPNPSDCQGFEPNIFRREKCKHCGHYWQLHRGVISEALLAPIRARRAGGASSSSAAASAASSGGGGGGLRGGLGGGGEAISAAARGKAAARRREKRAAEDRWLYGEGQASSSDDGGGDSDDGFRMFVPPALGQLRRRESAPAAAGPRIVNLIDFSECDVPIPASHRRRPAAAAAAAPPPPPPPQPPLPLPASGATSAASSSSSAAWAASAEIAADGLAARASPAAAATAAAAVVGGGPPRYEHLDPLPGLPPPPPLLDLGPDPAAAVAAAAAAFAQGPAAPGFSTAAAPLEDLKASLQLSTSLLAGCLRDADREEARAVAGGLCAAVPGLAATWQGGGPGAAPWQTQQEGARVMERAMAAAALAVEEANHIMQQDAAERKKMERTCAALQDEARRLSFTCRDLGKANNDMRRRLAAVESELSKKTKDLAWWEVTEEAAATVLTEAELSKWECDLRAASTRSLAKLTDRRVEIRVGSAAAAAAAAITDGTLCKICYDRPSACALLPCRHHAFCGPCARCIESSREPACPLCRTPVSGLFETFAG